MSQVQIRQVPVATSTDAQRVVGSWFPSGYYGHFRAKSRADLCQYFRQLARPDPPRTFLDRQHAEATTHRFSRHDNRFKFECDPLVRCTQTGFGKRKSGTNARGEFDPLFVSWVPKHIDRKAFVDDAKISSYAENFNRDSTTSRTLSEVQPKPTMNTESDRTATPSESELSVYSMVYQHGQPDQQQSKQIRRETYQRFLTARTRLLRSKRHDRSTNVAACLVWNNPQNENSTPKLPTSTDSLIHIAAPVTLQPRVIPNNSSPRQRAHSAGPRLMSMAPTESTFPPAAKPFQSSSIQMLKPTGATIERPHTATTTSREHFSGANFGLQKEPPPRALTSFEPKHTNSMDSLISKYM